jgi:hypothetical protein
MLNYIVKECNLSEKFLIKINNQKMKTDDSELFQREKKSIITNFCVTTALGDRQFFLV